MLRNRLSEALKSSMKEKDQIAVSTLRLILAAVKDRDIGARSRGGDEGISETEILNVLQTMVRQRNESIALYRKGGRDELADREEREISVIEQFMPRQLGEEEIAEAIAEAIAETGAESVKDMGKTMGLLRRRYAGRMDFGKAGAALKTQLTS